LIKYNNIIVFGSLFITATGKWISHTAIRLLAIRSNGGASDWGDGGLRQYRIYGSRG